MITATLRRTQTGDTGTFGEIDVLGEKFATGELPWRNNAGFVSCIPAGDYVCRWTKSPKFGHFTYEIMDVLDREHCRFHLGNWVGDRTKGLRCDVDGCILLGFAVAPVLGQLGVLSSGRAIERFEGLLKGQDFLLTITDEYLETGAPPVLA